MADHVYPINASGVAAADSVPPRHPIVQESLVPMVDRQLGACRRSGSCLALLSISVDNLETVRQRHGAAFQDQILHSIWSRLRGRLRASDIAVHADHGDFAAILLDASGMAAAVVDERLTAALCEPYCIDEMEIGLSVKTGFSVYPQSGETGEELVKAAIRAKNRGTQGSVDGRRA